MKKLSSKLRIYIFLMLLFIPFLTVKADNIKVDDVINYMNDNNIFTEKDYFQLFGRVLNGNNENDINKIEYKVTKEDDKAIVKVTLNDTKQGKLEKETILTITENEISYTNQYAADTLESRIDTILFTQIVYSIGGARGYNKEVLVNWMNQIDLENLTEESGITSTTEKVKYTYQVGEATYDYTINVPKQYTIDINKLTTNIPVSDYVQIKEVGKSVSSITLSIYAENHLDEECDVYRLNKDSKYEKIGTTSCNNGEIADIDLDDNTTYTYQASVKDKINCSDTKAITTDEIPTTGASIFLGGFIALGIFSIILYIVQKRYNVIKKV